MIKRGMKFGNWEVVNTERAYIGKYANKAVLCYDVVGNILKYVNVYHLLNGVSKGSKESMKGRFSLGGHSTRYKNKDLPKYVYKFPLGELKYRVMKKIGGRVETLSYFKTVEAAKSFAGLL